MSIYDLIISGSQIPEGSQMAEQLGNRFSNQKVAGSIPGRAITLCPWARHFTLLASGNVPLLAVSRSG